MTMLPGAGAFVPVAAAGTSMAKTMTAARSRDRSLRCFICLFHLSFHSSHIEIVGMC